MTTDPSPRITAMMAVEPVAAEPPGYVVRVLIRRDGVEAEILGPTFAASVAAVSEQLHIACDYVVAVLRATYP